MPPLQPMRSLETWFAALLFAFALASGPALGAVPPQAGLADFNDGQTLINRVTPWSAVVSNKPLLKVDLTKTPRRGTRGLALRVRYTFSGLQDGEQGLSIKLPEVAFSDYDHLSLWIRGDRKRGYPNQLRVRFLDNSQQPAEQSRAGFMAVGIDEHWRQLLIPLNGRSGVAEGANPVALSLAINPGFSPDWNGVFYIDDIALVKTGQHVGEQEDRAIAPAKKLWEMARGGEQLARTSIRARAVELPAPPLERRDSLPLDDRALFERVAQDTWRGLDGLRDRPSGLPFDTVTLHVDGPPSVGDYTNVTNIGLYLMSVVAARDLGFISPKEAESRLLRVVKTLEQLETYQGFFYNYYDTTSLERTSHFISFVDSSWLTAGLMVARMAAPDLYNRISRLLERENYGFFYDPIAGQMTHGYHVQRHERSVHHYGLLYSEPRLGSLIAIGQGDVPESHWFSLARTFPVDWTWQSMTPLGRAPRVIHGYEVDGGYYSWHGIRYLPSWGGSMFEAMMPGIVLDSQTYAPASLGPNAVAHVDIQRRYALEELSLPV